MFAKASLLSRDIFFKSSNCMFTVLDRQACVQTASVGVYIGPLRFYPRKFPIRNETAASRSWLISGFLSGLSVCRKSCYTYTPDLEKISSCALFSNLHKRCQKLGMGNRKCEMILKMSLYLAQEAWNGPREDSLACLVTRSAHLNRKNKLKKYSWLWSIKVVAGSCKC